MPGLTGKMGTGAEVFGQKIWQNVLPQGDLGEKSGKKGAACAEKMLNLQEKMC